MAAWDQAQSAESDPALLRAFMEDWARGDESLLALTWLGWSLREEWVLAWLAADEAPLPEEAAQLVGRMGPSAGMSARVVTCWASVFRSQVPFPRATR